MFSPCTDVSSHSLHWAAVQPTWVQNTRMFLIPPYTQLAQDTESEGVVFVADAWRLSERFVCPSCYDLCFAQGTRITSRTLPELRTQILVSLLEDTIVSDLLDLHSSLYHHIGFFPFCSSWNAKIGR